MINPLKIYGEHDDKTIQQMWRCLAMGDAWRGVLCADGHLGYSQPVGGVVAYPESISVSGVGYDIACGNMAVKLDLTYNDIKDRIPTIAKDISRSISFGVGRSNNEKAEHALFESKHWPMVEADVKSYLTAKGRTSGPLLDKARAQLGTVGSGNHYVDVFRDLDDDHIWIGVHFGSRGTGHTIASTYLYHGGGKDGIDEPPTLLNDISELGQRYFLAMTLAGQYAYAGREWVVDKVRNILGGRVTVQVHNHHNYAWNEEHNGRNYWVVRKGATPAFPGQLGFIGGSMGDNALIVEGVESPESRLALYSTVHGAGRICSRTAAKGKKDKKTDEWKVPPRFTKEEMSEWLKKENVYLIGGDVDESPMAYRRLHNVIEEHAGTVNIKAKLKPIIVLMAGNEIRDPYKD
jgi:tRNA-splicing ligase RtcB